MQPELNIYVCSTVRHLLFALLRADLYSEEQHYILFFSDYQHTSLADWHLDSLPVNVTVHEMGRGIVRQHMDSSVRGRLCYFFAMRNWQAPEALLAPLRALLADSAPQVSAALNAARTGHGQPQLWLFNERNRMARLLRLLIPRFSLIEDGESNYRLLLCAVVEMAGRLLSGLPPRSRVLGEESCCESYPGTEPRSGCLNVCATRGVQIDFLEQPSARELMDGIFNAAEIPGMHSRSSSPRNRFASPASALRTSSGFMTRSSATCRRGAVSVYSRITPPRMPATTRFSATG
jgi:hypothetical protein